jgi:hypothetical protein
VLALLLVTGLVPMLPEVPRALADDDCVSGTACSSLFDSIETNRTQTM